MELTKNNAFSEMTYEEMDRTNGGFVIVIGALTITGAALAIWPATHWEVMLNLLKEDKNDVGGK